MAEEAVQVTLAAELGLERVAEDVYVRPMLTLDGAIDFACSGLAAKTRSDYTRLLHRFAKGFPSHMDVAKVTEDDIARYLAERQHANLDPATLHWEYRVLYATFKKLVRGRKIKLNPVDFVPAPRRPDLESRDLVRVSTEEVGLLLDAAETWSEKLCLGVLVYLGPRRAAASRVRLSDYRNGHIRFVEKGGKRITKKVPAELRALLAEAQEAGAFWAEPHDYLIPPEGEPQKAERDDRIVWRIVKRVADRAGVRAHTHSLRAAFAHFALDSGKDSKALQEMMGHANPATTERYTQRYDREKRMDTFEDLSWASVRAGNNPVSQSSQSAADWLKDSVGVGAGGFEPPQAESLGAVLPDSLFEAIRKAIQQEMGRTH